MSRSRRTHSRWFRTHAGGPLAELLERRTLLSTLVVNGTSSDDRIALGVTPSGGVEVTINGQTTDYAPNQWTDVSVDSGDARVVDQINVTGTVVPVTITGEGSGDVMVGGPSGVQNVAAPIRVNGFRSGTTGTDISLDDSGDSTPRAVSITATPPNSAIVPKLETISGLAPALVSFTAAPPDNGLVSPNLVVPSLFLTTGSGDDTINVRSTLYLPLTSSSNPPMTETLGSIRVDNSGGNDRVRVESLSAASVNGAVFVGSKAGSTTLTVDNSNGAAGQYTFGVVVPLASSLPRSPYGFDTVTFVAAGSSELRLVSVASNEFNNVQAVTIDGGPGGNSFTGSEDLPSLTLDTGSGNDRVTLSVSDGSALAVNGGAGDDVLSLTGFGSASSRSVTFDGGDGNNGLLVFAAAAPSGQQQSPYVLTNGKMTAGGDLLNYSHVGLVQLEGSGAWQAKQDLGPIDLLLGGDPFAPALPIPATSTNARSIEFDTSQHLDGLSLFATSATLTSGGGKVLDTGSLFLLGNASLDLTDNSLRVHYPSAPDTADPFVQTRRWIFEGVIFSTLSDAHHSLGYADSADGVVPNLPSNTILVKYALRGDANLDGQVNFADLVLLAAHYGKTLSDNWDQGDFNYDGRIDFADLVLLAANYGNAMTAASARRR